MCHLRDQMQFAYCRNRCVQDASVTFINDISKHLDKRNTSARILFTGFTSAFNTLQQYILLNKMLEMGYNGNILKWSFSFLTNGTSTPNLAVNFPTKLLLTQVHPKDVFCPQFFLACTQMIVGVFWKIVQ